MSKSWEFEYNDSIKRWELVRTETVVRTITIRDGKTDRLIDEHTESLKVRCGGIQVMPRQSISQGRRLRRPTVSVRDVNDNNRERVVRTQLKRNEVLRPTTTAATTSNTTTTTATTTSENKSE